MQIVFFFNSTFSSVLLQCSSCRNLILNSQCPFIPSLPFQMPLGAEKVDLTFDSLALDYNSPSDTAVTTLQESDVFRSEEIPLSGATVATKEEKHSVDDLGKAEATAFESSSNPDSENQTSTYVEPHVTPDPSIEPTVTELNVTEDAPPRLWQVFVAACQSGDLPQVIELISSGAVKATDSCDEGITGLHWAAINNRLSVVKYLVENEYSRADVNRVGGKLDATPLHWACRGGLVYVVDYLLSNTEANPTLKDSQNYNVLHLAVLSSNITLIAYILLKCVIGDKTIYIDDPDLIDCTPLHWAAYRGDILSVNILLQYGSDVTKVDRNLMTPLHWAFITGNKHVLAALEDAGSDIFTKNDSGKDSFAIAEDMDCVDTWLKVLEEADRNPKRNWEKRTHPVPAKTWKIVTFLAPYVVLPAIFLICSFSDGFVIPKLFLSVLIVLSSMVVLQRFVYPEYMPKNTSSFQTPLLSGIFSGTAFWCIMTFFLAILPRVIFHRFRASTMLTGVIVVLTYCFYKTMTINPGYVPIPADASVIFKDIKELIKLGQFDTDHFCINTFIRRPLRSKYSRSSKRLVARFDHYCPWVYNDVGVRNHKVFFTFVYSLIAAIFLYLAVAKKYFDLDAEKFPYKIGIENLCLFLSKEMCLGYRNNHFIFNIAMWSTIQSVWVIFLAVTQTFQVLKGLTTAEFSKLNRWVSAPSLTHSTVPRDFQERNDDTSGDSAITPPHSHAHAHKNGFLVCMKLLGLDQFIMTVKIALLSLFVQTTHSHRYSSIESLDIPSDFGWKQNWLDFWYIGNIEWRNLFYLPIDAENNLNGKVVDYYKFYEYPTKHAGSDAV